MGPPSCCQIVSRKLGVISVSCSSYRTPLTAQSNVEKSPPQTPKLPPRTGARALIAVKAMSSSDPDLLSHATCRTSYSTLAVWTVPEAFNAVPYCPLVSKDPLKNPRMVACTCTTDSLKPCQYLLPDTRLERHTPIQKAPPKSLRATHGHGSLE